MHITRETILSNVLLALRNAKSVPKDQISTPVPDTDLAIVYIVPVDDTKSIVLRPKDLKAFDIDEQEIKAAAVENTSKQEYVFENLAELLDYDGNTPWQPPLYVCTSKGFRDGASVILNGNFMKSIAEKLNDDLYIIPSSIHEVLVLPKTGFEKDALALTIASVNQEHVAPDDVLSDQLFTYTRSTAKLAFA